MVQSHCKIKGSLSLPPIGGFIANIAPSRKVRARKPAVPPGPFPAPAQGLPDLNFPNIAKGLGRSSATGPSAASTFHSAGTSASGLRG
jgi:hypothetical protein